MDAAFQKIFAGLTKKAPPKKHRVTGRPPKTSTLADLAPLPKGVQAKPATMSKMPPLPTLQGN
jgi:hypothetical protein